MAETNILLEPETLQPVKHSAFLHYVLDLWFERVVKTRLRGEAHMIRYIDDFGHRP